MKFEIELFTHEELDRSVRQDIIRLKRQYWNYSEASQLQWMRDNLLGHDEHLCLRLAGQPLSAYLNLVFLRVKVNGTELEAFGIGNVCVDKQYAGNGMGALLMASVGALLKLRKQSGLLLCKDSLVPFYQKCGWFQCQSGMIRIGNQAYTQNLMSNSTEFFNDANTTIEINRNF